jgi:hypothetical protein
LLPRFRDRKPASWAICENAAMSEQSDWAQPRHPAAHDVLAAEEFALPAPDPSIAHPPVKLPEDPSGIVEPHDVLAAEEFALPASPPHPIGSGLGPAGRGLRSGGAVLGVLALVILGGIVRRRAR